MASSMLPSSVTIAAQATMIAPFTGLKSAVSLPITKKANLDITSITSNGGRAQCMQVWPPRNVKKFETLSYLPDLPVEALLKQVQYILDNKWIPCLEFTVDYPFVTRENNRSPGYYDGRYWTMWKLPMFGCTDPALVVNEVEEVKKAYPDSYVKILGFDNKRQVQCFCIIARKPNLVSA